MKKSHVPFILHRQKNPQFSSHVPSNPRLKSPTDYNTGAPDHRPNRMGYKEKRRGKTMSHRKRKKGAVRRGGKQKKHPERARTKAATATVASEPPPSPSLQNGATPTSQKRSTEDSDAAVEHLEDAARHDAHLRPRLQHRELGGEAAPLLFHLDVQRAGLAA